MYHGTHKKASAFFTGRRRGRLRKRRPEDRDEIFSGGLRQI